MTVIDAGQSRCAAIPLTRNHAGFPDGISGEDLLARMRRQAVLYGSELVAGDVLTLDRLSNGSFRAQSATKVMTAHAVLLATGVVNRRPPLIEPAIHDRAVAAGQLRYCPVCDGFEMTDRKVAVMGTDQRGCDEALFLRSYTRDVTLVASGDMHSLTADQRRSLSNADIMLAEGCVSITLTGKRIALGLPGGIVMFDSLYPALGSDIQSSLARQIGAAMSDDGCLTVDTHQRTNVAGFYAAGDVVLGLDQISHAMGEGEVAATTIRNDLAKREPLRR